MPLLTSPRNPPSNSYISSRVSDFHGEKPRDAFERPKLRPIQQQSSLEFPAERQTLPPLSTTISYAPSPSSSGSSTSYNNFTAPASGGTIQTLRGLVPVYTQLNASNNDFRQHASQYHAQHSTSPAQLAPLLQHTSLTRRHDDFSSGLTLPPIDSRFAPAQNEQAKSYCYQAMPYHDVHCPSQQQDQQQPQHPRPQQQSVTSPWPTSYLNNTVPQTSHQALPGFSTLPTPFSGFHGLYAPAQPRSSGTSMLDQQATTNSFPPMSSWGYGPLQPMQVGDLQQPEQVLGSSTLSSGRKASGRRESRKRRSVVG